MYIRISYLEPVKGAVPMWPRPHGVSHVAVHLFGQRGILSQGGRHQVQQEAVVDDSVHLYRCLRTLIRFEQVFLSSDAIRILSQGTWQQQAAGQLSADYTLGAWMWQ